MKKRVLSIEEMVKAADWVRLHKDAVLRMPRHLGAIKATRELGFSITEANLRGITRALGLEQTRAKAKGLDVLILANSILKIYQRLNMSPDANLTTLVATLENCEERKENGVA